MPAAQQTLNRIYFESGKQKVVINFIFTDRGAEFNQQIRCESPSIYDPPFRPFNYWKMTRAGEGSYTIDLRNGSEVVSPAVSASPGDRLNYSMENAIYFFLGDTWPTDDEYPQTLLDSLTAVSRWLWAPIAVYLVVTMLFNRGAGSATIICLAYLLLFLCQQTIVMEGRYRMPWEGIAIAATIEATANLRRRRAIT